MMALPSATTKTKPQTAPAFRVASTGQANGAGSVSVTISATAQVGDFAVAFHVMQDGRTSTPPAGWTPLTSSIADRPSTSVAPAIYVSTKVLASGDINSAKSWTNSATSDSAVVVVVYSGVGGISVLPVWNINNTTVAGGYSHYSPELEAGPTDRIVTAVGAHTVIAIGAAGADPSAPPSGFTQRGNAKGGNGGLVKPRSITVADAGVNVMAGKKWTFSQLVYTGMVSLALRPAVARTKDIELLPSSLYGKPIYAYGASYHNFVLGGGGTGNSEHITDAIIHRRMMNAGGRNASSKNFSMSTLR